MIFLFIPAACFYLIVNSLILVVLKRNRNSDNTDFKSRIKNKSEAGISIVVAAKNEEENIQNLIQSIYAGDYDAQNFEVIVVDDQSTDKTFTAVKEMEVNYKNLRVISSIGKPFPGKKGALAIGINESRNNYILITDADCIVSKKWISAFTEEFNNGNDFVFGAAPLTNNLPDMKFLSEQDNQYKMRKGFLSRGLLRNGSLKNHSKDDGHFDQREKSLSQFETKPIKNEQTSNENNFISKLSCFENLRSSLLTFTASKLGMPYSAAARSFGFKKSSFEKLEGYSRTTETLSGDDDLLLREAVKAKMGIGCITEPDAFVYSETKKSFNEYLIQKSRHTKTSTHYLFKSQFMLGLWHMINLLLLASVFLIPVDSIYILFFLLKLFVDVIVVLSLQRKFGYSFNLIQIILLQPVYEVMIVINFFSAVLLPDKWK